MNFSTKIKIENDKFRCKFYKDKSHKCKAFVEFNKEGKVVNYNNNHTCKVDEKKLNMLLINNEIKESINKTAITNDIKANNLFYNSLTKVNKRKKEYSFDDEDDKNEKR